jgi:hypothetical protein
VRGWAPTKKSLHLYTQMLGKLRVALSPDQPNWMFTALYLTARGLTTGPVPCEGRTVEASLDVFASRLRLDRSDGRRGEIALLPPRSRAAIYADLCALLAALEVPATISTTPQEVADLTPLDSDDRPADYDPAAVLRWFTATTSAATVFEEWRSHFFGRSGIQYWWGGFDFALLLFNGKKAAAPTDRGYIMRYDLDAEIMNAGLYFGEEDTPPFFYGYISPEPQGCAEVAMPPGGSWSRQLGEWVLPYAAVRASADGRADLRAFLDAIYTACSVAAGWDPDAHTYVHPPRRAIP